MTDNRCESHEISVAAWDLDDREAIIRKRLSDGVPDGGEVSVFAFEEWIRGVFDCWGKYRLNSADCFGYTGDAR